MKYNNEKGFTLIELLISIAIVAVAIGLSSFGIKIVFDSNLDSYANQYKTDLREARNGTLSTLDEVYHVIWKYDSTNGRYYYEVWDNSVTNQLMKTVNLHKSIYIMYTDNVGITTELKDLIAAGTVSISFDRASGKALSGSGTYLFKSTATDQQASIKLIAATGGIFLD
ncbi:prepilin-type N-terminal cleavage/methylation domain-containing protein [Armatimonadetes bacterium]|nr:prepilin-type N-terminal cleavage/methylation domain-containing protein [bacterium]